MSQCIPEKVHEKKYVQCNKVCMHLQENVKVDGGIHTAWKNMKFNVFRASDFRDASHESLSLWKTKKY